MDRTSSWPASSPPAGLVQAFVELSDRVGVAVLVTSGDAEVGQARYVFANVAATELLGTSLGDLLSLPVQPSTIAGSLFVPDETEPSHLSAKGWEQQGELRRPDGQHSSVSLTRVDTVVDGESFTVHLVRTLERPRGVEQALLDSELRFRRLMDVAPDGILVFRRRRIVYANQAVTRMHGYSHPRQLSQLSPEQLFSPEDTDAVKQRLLLLKSDPASIQALEVRGVRRDQKAIPVELVLMRTEWDDGPAVLATVRDLSGRRLIQSQLVHDDRLAAVGTLAAGVAHEINNPLAYVLLNLQYLSREVPRLVGDHERAAQLSERVREARQGAERVVAIVKDLRSFSKENDEHLGPLDLRRVLSSAVKVAQSQLLDRCQIVEQFVEVPPALGHAARLEQVFLNLLVNAIQALSSEQGQNGRIIVRTFLEQRQGQSYVTVEVSDTGAGMDPAVLDRVFDPFFTTKPVGLGMGLGLPICHNIVTRMGGTIRAESKLGSGSSFFVSLPVAQSAPRNLTPNPSFVPVQAGERARILVVDDELPVATMLSRVLDEEHDVVVAPSAEAALELLEQQRFDVVFCDLLMPTMSGMELYSEVLRRHPGQEKRIAFMTGGAFTPRAAQFLSRVPNPRIEKPFDLLAVHAIVQNLMNRGD